jgi:hypothetical protein
MKQKFPVVRFALNSVLNGVGMLVIANPFPVQPDFVVTDGGIGHHFSRVGNYLRDAITVESPKLAEELKFREEPQLELPLSA